MTTTPNTTASGAADGLRAVFRSLLPDLPDTNPFTLFEAGVRHALAASAPVAPAVGNSGFDYKTAADLLNGKTVRDEAIRKFVAASRWAHDDSAGLRATLISARGELASREAEIALLKKILMDAEPAPQPAVPKKKPLPDLMMAAYHEAIGWNACVDAMNVATAPKAAPASPYHDGVNIENLQRACRALGLRTDDSLEAFVSPDVHADHINRLTTSVVKYALTRSAPLQQGEYLPCPFCGNVSINLTVIDDRSFIMCNSCGACCDSIDTLPESEPGDVWNRRVARGAAQAAPAVTVQGRYYDAHFATPP